MYIPIDYRYRKSNVFMYRTLDGRYSRHIGPYLAYLILEEGPKFATHRNKYSHSRTVNISFKDSETEGALRKMCRAQYGSAPAG
jgi:hypothetical protein